MYPEMSCEIGHVPEESLVWFLLVTAVACSNRSFLTPDFVSSWLCEKLVFTEHFMQKRFYPKSLR